MRRLIRKAALSPEQYIENYPNGYEHIEKGIQNVNVDDIIGMSYERKDEYDSNMQPIGEPDDRWKRLYNRAKEEGNLNFVKPVNLVKVPDENKYFVYDDGNHRVSVAKALKIPTIPANIFVLVPKTSENYKNFELKSEEIYDKIKELEQKLRDLNKQQQKLYDIPGLTIDDINQKYEEIENQKNPLYTQVDKLYEKLEELKQNLIM